MFPRDWMQFVCICVLLLTALTPVLGQLHSF